MKKYITFIDGLKIIHHVIITRNTCFGPKYNVKQKYLVLFPNYDLKKENYKEKFNLLTFDLSLKARL